MQTLLTLLFDGYIYFKRMIHEEAKTTWSELITSIFLAAVMSARVQPLSWSIRLKHQVLNFVCDCLT